MLFFIYLNDKGTPLFALDEVGRRSEYQIIWRWSAIAFLHQTLNFDKLVAAYIAFK